MDHLAASLAEDLGGSAPSEAVRALHAILCVSPTSLRTHQLALVTKLSEAALAQPAHSRLAAKLLGALPLCLSSGGVEDAWSNNVERLAGTMAEALQPLLGSVTRHVPVPYALPKYALPPDALPAGAAPAGSGADQERQRRDALVRSARRCALALHCSCRTGSRPGVGPAGAVPILLPVPVGLLMQLASHVLAADGLSPLRAPAVDTVTHAALVPVLAAVHEVALQLLHTVLLAGRRLVLPHAVRMASVIRHTLTRTGRGGPAHLRSARLRCAAYALGEAMLHTLGPCVAPLLAEGLVHAALVDLRDHRAASVLAARSVDAVGRGGSGSGRKRARRKHGGGEGADTVAPPSTSPLVCAAVRASSALLLHGSELLPLSLLAALQNGSIEALSAPGSLPEVDAALVGALHTSLSRPAHVDTMARSLTLFRALAALGTHTGVRQAAQLALHQLDAIAHPRGCGSTAVAVPLSVGSATAGAALQVQQRQHPPLAPATLCATAPPSVHARLRTADVTARAPGPAPSLAPPMAAPPLVAPPTSVAAALPTATGGAPMHDPGSTEAVGRQPGGHGAGTLASAETLPACARPGAGVWPSMGQTAHVPALTNAGAEAIQSGMAQLAVPASSASGFPPADAARRPPVPAPQAADGESGSDGEMDVVDALPDAD